MFFRVEVSEELETKVLDYIQKRTNRRPEAPNDGDIVDIELSALQSLLGINETWLIKLFLDVLTSYQNPVTDADPNRSVLVRNKKSKKYLKYVNDKYVWETGVEGACNFDIVNAHINITELKIRMPGHEFEMQFTKDAIEEDMNKKLAN